jgi:hypothetical protein
MEGDAANDADLVVVVRRIAWPEQRFLREMVGSGLLELQQGRPALPSGDQSALTPDCLRRSAILFRA